MAPPKPSPPLSPSQLIAAQTRHQLTSPRSSSSKAPDTPPNTFDDLFDSPGTKTVSPSYDTGSEKSSNLPWSIETAPPRAPLSTTTPSAGADKSQPDMVPFPRSGSGSGSVSSPAKETSLGGQTPSASPGRKTRVEVEGALSRGRYDSKFTKPLDSSWLKSKNREQLEDLLTKADKVLKEKELELDLFASAGKQLLDENRILKEELATTATAVTVASPINHNRTRSSLPFPTSPSTSRIRNDSIDGTGTEGIPSSPTGTLRFHHRSRLSSTASTSSLSMWTPSPRSVASTTAQELNLLQHTNFTLMVRASEAEAEKEELEREHRRITRKMERDLEAMRRELARAEESIVSMEDRQALSTPEGALFGSPRNATLRRARAVLEGGQTTPTSKRMGSSSLNEGADAQLVASPSREGTAATPSPGAPTTMPTTSNDFHGTPPSFRRQPGDGRIRTPGPSKTDSPTLTSPSTPKTSEDEPKREELVAQLKAKIEELRIAKEEQEAARLEAEENLEIAMTEALAFQKRCEDLEDKLVYAESNEFGGARAGEIEWRTSSIVEEDEDDSPTRPVRTRRMIESRQQHQASADSHNPTSLPESTAPRRGSKDQSLRNELRGEWATDSNSDFDDDRSSTLSGSHSTFSHMLDQSLALAQTQSTDVIGASVNLIPQGSLRTSDIVYEQLSRVVDDVLPLWEDEPDDDNSPGEKMTPIQVVDSIWVKERNEMDDAWEKAYPELEENLESNYLEIEDVKGIEDVKEIEEKDKDDQSTTVEGGEKVAKKRRKRRPRKLATDSRPGIFPSTKDDSPLSSQPIPPPPVDYSELGHEILNQDSLGSITVINDDETDKDDDDGESVISDFEELNAEGKRRADYWPVALRARYHPRMMVARATDSALQQLVAVFTFIRFFFLLAFALTFAIWQGPRKTLGMIDGRRRLR